MSDTIRTNLKRLCVLIDWELLDDPEWIDLLSGRWERKQPDGYIVRYEPDGTITYLHKLVTMAGQGQMVDHIHGDRSDCRRESLRLTDQTRNARNKSTSTRNTSGHTGVSWHKRKKRWQVQLAGKHLGYFLTEEEALAAREQEEVRKWGEDAPSHRGKSQSQREFDARYARGMETVRRHLADMAGPRVHVPYQSPISQQCLASLPDDKRADLERQLLDLEARKAEAEQRKVEERERRGQLEMEQAWLAQQKGELQ